MMERTSTASRERILKVAERMFAEEGFDRARVELIAAEAGVNKALIYYYFKCKEDMLDRIVEQIIDEGRELQQSVLEEMGEALADEPVPEELYKKGLAKALEMLEQRKDVLNIVYMEALKKQDAKNPLFRYFDSTLKLPLLAGEHASRATDRAALSIQTFYLGFLPLLCFVLLNEKWCQHYHVPVEEAKARFLDRFYHEFYVDTVLRMLK
jgi:AcrR family transcriptional regulator